MVALVIYPELHMFARNTRARTAALVVAAALVACNGAQPPLGGSITPYQSLPQLSAQVSQALGYAPQVIEFLAAPAHLHATVKDAALAALNPADRDRAAGRIVAAIEQAMATRQEFSTIQEITIAIIHLSQPESLADYSHVEDVLRYRKSPDGHFVGHAG
jgi:hypothetical protein